MSLPFSRILPPSGVSKPASMRSSVVLPQPDGPSSAKNSPARMSSESLSTAVKPPNRFVTRSMRNSGMSAAAIGGSVRAEALEDASSVMIPAGPGPAHASGGSALAQPRGGLRPQHYGRFALLPPVWPWYHHPTANEDWFRQSGWKNHDQTVQA